MPTPPLSTAWVPLWPVAPALPAVEDRKWVKGSGGAMVFAHPTGHVSSLTVASANTDMTLPNPDAPVNSFRCDVGGGSIRTISAPAAPGARCEIQLWQAGPAITLLHDVAGSGAKINTDFGTTVLPPGHTAFFTYITSGAWQLTGITRSGGGPVGVGTSLPNGFDGLEYILVDSLTAPTFTWRFRYNASASSTYKWEFIGGAPKFNRIVASESMSNGSYVDLATVGPSVVAPRAGIYHISFGATPGAVTAGDLAFCAPHITGAGSTQASDTFSAQSYSDISAGGSGSYISVAGYADNMLAVTAGDTIKMLYRSGFATSISFEKRWIAVTPVRLA